MYGSMLTGNVVNGSSNSNGCRGIDTSDFSVLVLVREMLLHKLEVVAEVGLGSEDFWIGIPRSHFRSWWS
jgi:hypothetical protein